MIYLAPLYFLDRFCVSTGKFFCRCIPLCLILVTVSAVQAAAPDDINTNQRAWYDAVDIDADSDYTNNPANNAPISDWWDISGSGNHISAAGTSQPLYRHNSISPQRHGLDFDGINDALQDTNDIWIGAVDTAEIFMMASTDEIKRSFLFGSTDDNRNRISAHTPWVDTQTYFDHGPCCGNPARLRGNLPVVLNEPYLWQFIGQPALQAVVRNGDTLLSDGGAGSYITNANSTFTIGGFSNPANTHHHGHVFEAIYYQTELNDAQRRILGSYLSAKWEKSLTVGADFPDVYTGDDIANGNYDFFVGGIGQDNGAQAIGTSQGLTITDNSFLTGNNKFVLAGVDYLLTAPITGQSSTDLPSGFAYRSNRSWYIDTTGTGGSVDLSFDATDIGIVPDNGSEYGLLFRPNTSGTFTEIARSTMIGGEVNFSLLPADGIYVIAKTGEIDLSLLKTVSNERPNIGDIITFTLSVRNGGNITATNAIVQDRVPAGLGNLIVGSFPATTSMSIVGNDVNWTNISVAAGAEVSATFTAQVLPP